MVAACIGHLLLEDRAPKLRLRLLHLSLVWAPSLILLLRCSHSSGGGPIPRTARRTLMIARRCRHRRRRRRRRGRHHPRRRGALLFGREHIVQESLRIVHGDPQGHLGLNGRVQQIDGVLLSLHLLSAPTGRRGSETPQRSEE